MWGTTPVPQRRSHHDGCCRHSQQLHTLQQRDCDERLESRCCGRHTSATGRQAMAERCSCSVSRKHEPAEPRRTALQTAMMEQQQPAGGAAQQQNCHLSSLMSRCCATPSEGLLYHERLWSSIKALRVLQCWLRLE